MFRIDEDMTIYITRGDTAFFRVSALTNGMPYKFQKGDIVRIKVMQKKKCENVAFQKDFPVVTESEFVDILLTEEETKIGDVISKPVDYWYEIELNPYTSPQTIIGYDDDGAKIFKLFPEGKDINTTVEPEDIPLVDSELSMTSDRPVQNQVIANAIYNLNSFMEAIDENASAIDGKMKVIDEKMKVIDENMENIDVHILEIASEILTNQPITVKLNYDANTESLSLETE